MRRNTQIAIGAVLYMLTAASARSQSVTAIDFPGAAQTRPNGVSPTGDIVGFYSPKPGLTRGFLLSEGVFSDIFVPGSSQTTPSGINARGEIVGFYTDATGTHGFLLNKKGTFSAIDVPGALRSLVNDINEHGDMVGSYVDAANKSHMFLLSSGVLFMAFSSTRAATRPSISRTRI